MVSTHNLERFAKFMAENPSPVNCEAGKFYDVPCFSHDKTTRQNRIKGWRKWLPLIGPLHEDAEIVGFPYYHIHVDTRFIKFDGIYQQWPGELLGAPLCLTGPDYWQTGYKLMHDLAILEVRRLKCYQSEPPPHPDVVPWRRAMENAYAHCRATNGLCPHRGIPLACGREISPGVRQCPGHGLAWDDDGQMVRLA